MTKYCWDTSVYIGWLNEEASAPLADIEAILNDIHAGRASLLVPVTVYTEIVRAKHTPAQVAAFDGFLERSNVMVVEQSMAVARKAEQVRSRGVQLAAGGGKAQKNQGRNIKASDAAIIATAILYQADALHSLEPKHIALNGSAIVDGLKITKPMALGGQLALGMQISPPPP